MSFFFFVSLLGVEETVFFLDTFFFGGFWGDIFSGRDWFFVFFYFYYLVVKYTGIL